MAESDDEYEIPLKDQRYFGSGLKRKRVHFVASSQTLQTTALAPGTSSTTAADRYLSIVLGKTRASGQVTPISTTNPPTVRTSEAPTQDQEAEFSTDAAAKSATGDADGLICEVCKCPFSAKESRASHESSIAHQISLQHSHPPSHLDRTRKGLTVLQDHGWDPDSRLGLGARGEGIRAPVKAVDNPTRAGLGAKLLPAVVKEKPTKLDAGRVRLLEQQGKKKAEMLRNAFYMSDDVQKYLGEAAGGHGGLDLEAFQASKRRR